MMVDLLTCYCKVSFLLLLFRIFLLF